jgi:hypothetical protein
MSSDGKPVRCSTKIWVGQWSTLRDKPCENEAIWSVDGIPQCGMHARSKYDKKVRVSLLAPKDKASEERS